MKLEKKENIKRDIGKRIEFIRNEKSMTKEEFARLINISGQHLGRVISGEKGLSIEKVVEISNKTGYSTDFILKGKTSELEIINEKISFIKTNLQNINEIIRTIVWIFCSSGILKLIYYLSIEIEKIAFVPIQKLNQWIDKNKLFW